MQSWAKRILVLAPHADDETIGCGGLLAAHPRSRRHVVVAAVGHFIRVNGETVTPAKRHRELKRALGHLGKGITHEVLTEEEGRLDRFSSSLLATMLDRVIVEFDPTAVFLPYPSHHQDHRALYHAALASLRPRTATLRIQMVAAYEYPFIAFDPAPLSAGKVHFSFDRTTLARKVRALGAYGSQMSGDPYMSVQRAESWSRSRGAEVNALAAEVFYIVRGRL